MTHYEVWSHCLPRLVSDANVHASVHPWRPPDADCYQFMPWDADVNGGSPCDASVFRLYQRDADLTPLDHQCHTMVFRLNPTG